MTTELEQLALVSGKPAFKEPLHVGRPNIPDRDRLMRCFEDILERRWVTNDGQYVREFERRVAEHVGVKHCVATTNGTIALEILIRALGLKGEVIVPSFTFVATAHALQWQEIRPVFCDVDPETHNIDPARVEQLITPNTSGIIGVHLWGRGCDVDALQDIADRHRLELAFDAAHAFSCSHQGRMIGGGGRAETFSFHATKFLSCFEGGSITTNDDDLADKMRLMRNFGFHGKDNVIYIGSNGKMTEVCAAMGVVSLDSVDEFIALNRRNNTRYRDRLNAVPGLRVIDFPADDRYNYQYNVVEVDAERAGLSRDQLVRVLEHENVLARRYFHPGTHRMEPYASLQPLAGLVLPETERLCERVMILPNGQAVSEEDVDRICDVVELACEHAEAVVVALEAAGTKPVGTAQR